MARSTFWSPRGTAKFAPIESVSEALFDELGDLMFKGVFFYCAEGAAAYAHGGAVVLVGSADSDKLRRVGTSNYSPAKAAARKASRFASNAKIMTKAALLLRKTTPPTALAWRSWPMAA